MRFSNYPKFVKCYLLFICRWTHFPFNFARVKAMRILETCLFYSGFEHRVFGFKELLVMEHGALVLTLITSTKPYSFNRKSNGQRRHPQHQLYCSAKSPLAAGLTKMASCFWRLGPPQSLLFS